MSVGGYLGGPGMRSYDRNRGCDYLDNNRYDSFLPTVWLTLGVGEPRFDYRQSNGLAPAGDGYGNGRDPRLNQDEAMFLATTRLTPHLIVRELLEEVAAQTRACLHGATRFGGASLSECTPGQSAFATGGVLLQHAVRLAGIAAVPARGRENERVV